MSLEDGFVGDGFGILALVRLSFGLNMRDIQVEFHKPSTSSRMRNSRTFGQNQARITFLHFLAELI